MRLVEFLSQLNEDRPPREMYHGTSSLFLRTILKQGIVPDPKEKKWDVDPDLHQGGLSRASLPGSYWTSNMMTAHGASTNTVMKFGGTPLMVIGMISEGSAYADEDDINSEILGTVGQVYREVFGGGIVADAVPKILAGIYWGDEAQDRDIRRQAADRGAMVPDDKRLNRHLAETYARLVHEKLSANPQRQPVPFDLLQSIFEALLLRGMAWEEKSSGGWGSPHVTEWKHKVERGVAPELPTVEEAEQQLLQLRDKLTRTYKKTAFYTPGAFSHTLRTPEPVTFRGSNRIIGILEEPDWRSTEKQPIVIHYGTITPGFLEQYRNRIGKFPGAVNKQGQMVIQPDAEQ